MNQCQVKFICNSEHCKYKEYEKGYEGLGCKFKNRISDHSRGNLYYYCQNEKAIIEAIRIEIEKRS